MDVSVAIPCFNGEDFLREAIESTLNQGSDLTFEVLVIDDGSYDEVAIREICEETGDSRVRYLRKENGGVGSALNVALRLAKGDAFCWLSHDDLFVEQRLARQFATWESSGRDSLVFGDFELFGELATFSGRVRLAPLFESKHPIKSLTKGLVNGCTVMTSRQLLIDVGGFNEELKATQDYDMWLRLASRGVEFVHMDEVLCKTRQHAKQESRINSLVAAENVALWIRLAEFSHDYFSRISTEQCLKELREMESFVLISNYLKPFGMKPVIDKLDWLMHKALSHLSVAIIIPTTGNLSGTRAAVRSACMQTHLNTHVFLVFDGDHISGQKFERDLGVESSNFTFLTSGQRSGVAFARNLGLYHAISFDYICFLDSDDEFLIRKCFEQLCDMVINSRTFSFTDYLVREGSGSLKNNTVLTLEAYHGPRVIAQILKKGCAIAVPTVMFWSGLLQTESEHLTEIELFPNGINFGEDAVAILRLLLAAEDYAHRVASPLTVVNANALSAKHDWSALGKAVDVINDEIGHEKYKTLIDQRASVQSYQPASRAKPLTKMKAFILTFLGMLPFSRYAYYKLSKFSKIQKLIRWLESR